MKAITKGGTEAKWIDFQWIWIDSCCIDRTSSAELAEDITSMYQYYRNAAECYAFLSDVYDAKSADSEKGKLQHSKWFTRGWTLQELLAPSRVIFINKKWKVGGHKCPEAPAAKCHCDWDTKALNISLAHITGIPISIINGQVDIRTIPSKVVCEWITNRNTTRVEDLAYCLIGLLRVTLLPIYGEGSNAWVRLEEEVSKKQQRELLPSRRAQVEETVELPRPAALVGDSLPTKTETRVKEEECENASKLAEDWELKWSSSQLPATATARLKKDPSPENPNGLDQSRWKHMEEQWSKLALEESHDSDAETTGKTSRRRTRTTDSPQRDSDHPSKENSPSGPNHNPGNGTDGNENGAVDSRDGEPVGNSARGLSEAFRRRVIGQFSEAKSNSNNQIPRRFYMFRKTPVQACFR